MSAKIHTVTISDLELHDICYAALMASATCSTRIADCVLGVEPMALRRGYELNREYFTGLYNKFHALRCVDEMILPESK